MSTAEQLEAAHAMLREHQAMPSVGECLVNFEAESAALRSSPSMTARQWPAPLFTRRPDGTGAGRALASAVLEAARSCGYR